MYNTISIYDRSMTAVYVFVYIRTHVHVFLKFRLMDCHVHLSSFQHNPVFSSAKRHLTLADSCLLTLAEWMLHLQDPLQVKLHTEPQIHE